MKKIIIPVRKKKTVIRIPVKTQKSWQPENLYTLVGLDGELFSVPESRLEYVLGAMDDDARKRVESLMENEVPKKYRSMAQSVIDMFLKNPKEYPYMDIYNWLVDALPAYKKMESKDSIHMGE